MPDDTDGADDGGDGDLELLESGNFSDVEIVSGARSWKCHTAILVPRSVWFHKALAGPFQEASTRQVKLDDENPVCVDLALQHIYGRGLDVNSSISPDKFIKDCVSLWHIADFLLLSTLKSSVQKAVHDYCDKQMKQLATRPCPTQWEKLGTLSPWALDFVSGLREAYKWNIKYLKAVLMEFMWVGRHQIFPPHNLSTVSDLFGDTPAIINDLVGRYSSSTWTKEALWAPSRQATKTPSKCLGCKTQLDQSKYGPPGHMIDPFTVSHNNTVSGKWCPECANHDKIPWRT